jgi:PAS domain S-box-containing protein
MQEQQASLEEAQRIASIGNFTRDIVTGVVTWSDELYRIFGYEPHSVPATWETTLQLIHPDDRERAITRRKNFGADNAEKETVFRIVRPDGELRTLRGRREIVCDTDGTPVRIVGTTQDITERQEQQASLEEAQRIASIGNFTRDLVTGVEAWSDELYRIYGYEPHSVPATYETTLALIHPDDWEQAIARRKNFSGDSAEIETVFRIIRPDGELRILRGRREIVCDTDGKPVRVVGTTQDITERQKQQELSTRLGRILEGLWEEIYVLDAETLRFMEVSRGARENLGYSMDELLEMTPANIVPHGHLKKIADFIAPLRSGESEMVELAGVHRRRDGSRYELEGHIQLSRDETPNVIIAVLRDVTVKNEAEKKLREQQEILEELVHTRAQELGKTEQYLQSTMRQLEHQKYALDAHSIVAVTDLRGRITYANQKFTDLSGYSQEELLGKTHVIVNSGHHPRSFFAELWRTVLHGDVWAGQIKNRSKDGTLYWVDSTIVPLHGDDEKVSGFVAIRTDITERKEQEIALEIAKEAAEASSVAKSAFLANMSHEIRTPMNGVLGMAELLLGTDLTEGQRSHVDAILRSGESLIMIIDDVLDLSKVEAGKLLITREPFDLEELTQRAAVVLAPQASKKALALIIRYAEDAPRHMLGDAARVRQILVNLIGNALKFTSEGHVLIEVEVDMDFRDGSALRIVVEDTGIGIEPGKLPHIFEAFTQADSTVTRKFGGSGLGLAISRQLVDMMEGTLEVESEVDRGTRFIVTIPFVIDEPGVAPEPLPSETEGRRILVIDPYERRRRIVVDQLLDLGLRCTALASGAHVREELLSAARGGDAYWGVVLDGTTPDTTPDEMADTLGSEDPAHCAFLMVLTEANNHLREASRLDKVRLIQISKPIIPSDLYEALRSIVAGGESGTRIAPKDSPTDFTSSTILLAEDNAVNQAVVLGHLEKHGCHVDVASNGLLACEMALKRPYDLIFMDVQMPVMDGLAATVEIRKTGHSPRAPIVAMTANAMEGDRKRCLDAGMDDYLSKPLRGDAIESILDTYLGGVLAPEPDSAPSESAGPQGPIPVLDLQEALDTTDGDVSLFRDLVLIVSTDLPERLRELQIALDTHDEEAILRVVHTIKGQAAHMGAAQLRTIAGEAEFAALEQDFDCVRDLAPRIVASAEELNEQLALIDWDALANGAKK